PNALLVTSGPRLVVSLGRSNALAVYRWQGASQPAVLEGLIPTGWYPGSLVEDTTRQQFIVANVKGVGSLGPKTSVGPSPDTARVGNYAHSYQGSVSLIPFARLSQLAADSDQVVRNNGWNRLDTTPGSLQATPRAIPLHIGDPSLIKHVVYIVRE